MDTDLSVTYLRRGMISILDVIAVKLPQVFTAEILPKLDVKDTLNLAQVNKAYNAAVWSADGVRSMEAKMKAAMESIMYAQQILQDCGDDGIADLQLVMELL